MEDNDQRVRDLVEFARVAAQEGNYTAVRSLYKQSLKLSIMDKNTRGIALSLIGFGDVAVKTGQPRKAARLLGASDALFEAAEASIESDDRDHYDRAMASARARLREEAFEQARQAGRGMSMEQAIKYALHEGAEDSFADPVLGVLFVHGIGDQKRGETVPWGGDPLFNWLRRWFGIKSDPNEGPDVSPNIYMTDARLARPIPSEGDAPPYARLTFNGFPAPDGTSNYEWILAESFWAQEFTPPSYGETVPFGLVVAPLILERIAFQILRRLLKAVRQPNSIGDITWRLMSLIIWPISFLVVFILGSLIQLFMVALAILGIVPFLAAVVPNLQLHLAGWLGDAYLMAVSPARLTAMVSQIRRDIKWLLNKGCCTSIAVIAHSGGAVVAHKALIGPDVPDFGAPVLLITYGSGQRKVHVLEQLNANRNTFWRMSPIFRIISAVLLLLSLLLMIQENPSWMYILVFGTVSLTIQGVLLFLLSSVNKDTDHLNPYTPTKPEGSEWVDYAAIADIVRDYPICAANLNKPKIKVTERINNLHSPFKDHSSYWRNQEEFLANVARLLYRKAVKQDLPPPAFNPDLSNTAKFFNTAKARRERRVLRLLTATLLLIGSLPGIWLALEPWLGNVIGAPLRDFLLDLIPGQALPSYSYSSDESFVISTSDLIWFWNHVFGVLALIAVVVLVAQQGLLALWRAWSSAEEAAFFNGKECKKDESSNRLKVRFGIFLIVTPLLCALLLIYRFIGAPPFRTELPPAPLVWTICIITAINLFVAIADAISTWQDASPGRAPDETEDPPCEPIGADSTSVTQQVLDRISANQT